MIDDGGGQDAFGQVIDAFESPARGGSDLSGPEQPFQRPFSIGPRPPAGRTARAGGEIAAGDRAALFDLGQDAFDIGAPFAAEPGGAAPQALAGLGPGHAPAEQPLTVQRQQRGLMAPVFEEARCPAPGLGLEDFAWIMTQAGEGRQIVGAADDIDAVDLDHAQITGGLAQMPRRRGGGPGDAEALGGQGDAPGLGRRQVHRPGHVAT